MKIKKFENNIEAFSLVELMISLITVSLVSAAFAPVITKKLSRSMVTVKSAVAAIRSDCAKFDENGGKCNACIDESCLLCDIHCNEHQYKNIGKCRCENCSERSEGCLECSSQGCDKCADGYYIDESLKCVKCPKGSKCPNGKKRELCPIGYYQDEEKKTTCKPCLTKNGNYTNKEGSTACLSCVAGQYTVDKNWDWHWDGKEHYGTACATCPAGHYCPDGKSAYGCGNNTYQDETGKTTCKGCPTGTYSPNSPSSSCSRCDGKCTACYQSATNCSSCKNGNYLTGSSCNSCPANASCNGGTNGFSCNWGTIKSGSYCAACPANATCDGTNWWCNSGYTLQNGSCVISHQQPVCQISGLCSFSGNIVGDWMLTIKGSTVVAFPSQEEVDLFAVGGGGAGYCKSKDDIPGGGGGGGYTKTVRNKIIKGSYNATVGNGADMWTSRGGTTSFGDLISAEGGYTANGEWPGTGGSGGGRAIGWSGRYGGSDGGAGENGASGQGSTTRAFQEPDGTLYAGGGGSGASWRDIAGAGGAGGGGRGSYGNEVGDIHPVAGQANTGGGGGGSGGPDIPGANGGSGIILIRNARWHY